jgi:hypothetical protein
VHALERGEDFGFPLKTHKPIAVRSQRGRQDLDGDLPLQLGIGGPVHLAHAAFADLCGDFVDAETGAGS